MTGQPMSNQKQANPTINHRALNGFNGKIKRVWKSPFYVAALAIVSLFMVLLPLVYVGIIGGVGYATYYHATNDWMVMSSGGGSGRGRLYKFILLYIMPLVVGVVLIAFMIKPLFARPGRRDKRLSLVRDNDPVIFEFVDRVCAAVGAPRPKRIDVDCEVNASARFRRDWISMFLPGDLVLTLGAPLLAGLSLNEFAGVLAHEFGHFSQGLGMRLSNIIMSVNHWFVRVVYERDSWDDWLVESSENESGWVSLIFMMARLFVWITRKILWLLMIVGQAVSCALLRQMEYDADRHEIRLVGSEVFKQTSRRMGELSIAGQALMSEMNESWKDGKLPDNYPIALAAKSDDIPENVRESLREHIAKQKTGLFHSHPSDAARAKRADKENADPIFSVDAQPGELFSQFEGLCKAATFSYYQDLVGPSLKQSNLMPTAALIDRRKKASRGRKSSERYFCGALSALRPIRIDPFSKALTNGGESNIKQIKRARAALAQSMPAIAKLYETYTSASETIIGASAIAALAKHDLKLSPDVFDLKSKTAKDVPTERDQAMRSLRESQEQIAKIEAVIQLRLESGVGLISSDAVAKRVKDWKKLEARARELVETSAVIHRTRSAMDKIRNEQLTLRVMVNLIAEDPKAWGEDLLPPAKRISAKQHAALADILMTLGDHKYPFAHADGRVSLADYAIGKLPSREAVFEISSAADTTIDHLQSLYLRVMGELAQIAEGVEHVLGFDSQSQNRPVQKKKAATQSA
ncbi:MAG: hypothetical protein DHS20C16_25150 [Phycisphaerae bacterium]|nr:MAG: hypothetical protein DHS20C16_25150 [Phycisphaerae bacterium]